MELAHLIILANVSLSLCKKGWRNLSLGEARRGRGADAHHGQGPLVNSINLVKNTQNGKVTSPSHVLLYKLTSRGKTVSHPPFINSCCTVWVLQQRNLGLALGFSNAHSFISPGLSCLMYCHPSCSRPHIVLCRQGSRGRAGENKAAVWVLGCSELGYVLTLQMSC